VHDYNKKMKAMSAESVQKAYKRYSNVYDMLFGAIFNPGRKIAIEALNCQAGDQILEVGVGTGLSLPFYKHNVQVTGIDLSKEMLQKAQEKVKAQNLAHVAGLFHMDAQKMDFPTNAFDKVMAMYVASVVPSVAELANEIRRVCKPGGTVIFLNHFESQNPWFRQCESILQPLSDFIGFHPSFSKTKFFEQSNFKFEQQIPVNIFNYWTILVAKNHK
jgi:phosphatidylethanolamine/phosphatidyl-N-methylethanolamine N-methyltransferase